MPPSEELYLKFGLKFQLGPNVSIGKNVIVGAGTRIRESVILANSVIGSNSLIMHAVIGKLHFQTCKRAHTAPEADAGLI